jgi:hypothetical protein
VSFALAAGRVCVQYWAEPLQVDDVVGLLIDLRDARRTSVERPILILVVQNASVANSNARDVLLTAMPAILDCCAELLVVAATASSTTHIVRTLLGKPSAHSRPSPRLFASVDDALRHAQGIAPHEVLELLRQSLRRSRPPQGAPP